MSGWTRRIGRRLNMDFDYVAKGGAWLGLDQTVNVATSVATTVALTNALSKSDYGSYTYAVSIFLILLPITLPGVGNAMVRSVARGFEGVWREGMRRRLSASLVVSAALAAIGVVFVARGRAELAWSLFAGAALYPFAFAADDYKSFYHGRSDFAGYARVNCAVNVFTASAIVAAALAGWPPAAVIAVNLGARGIANIAAYQFAHRGRSNDNVDDDFRSFGGNLSWVAAINSVSHYLDRVLVGSMFSMETMAVYALAANITEPLHVLSVFVNRLAWPKGARMEPAVAAQKFHDKFGWLLLAGAAVFAASLIAVPVLIRLLFPDYRDAVVLTYWMTASALLGIFVTYLETYLISQDHLHRTFYAASVARPLAVVAALYPCMVVWGYMGAIYARLAVRVASVIVLYGLLRREKRRTTRVECAP